MSSRVIAKKGLPAIANLGDDIVVEVYGQTDLSRAEL